MAFCSLNFIVTAIVAPLLLAMQWFGSRINLVPAKSKRRSNLIMMDSNSVSLSELRSMPLPLPARPCQTDHYTNNMYARLPYCDATLFKTERVNYLLTHLTPEEKISLLGHDSPAIIKQGIIYLPAYKWWNEGLHGMAWTDCCPPYEWTNVTVFPQVIGLAMTWNRTLWSEIGGVIGDEATAKGRDDDSIDNMASSSKGIHPGLTYFTPNINIFRDPRWGRGQETPGEDPYLTSHYAAVMVMSLQYGNEFMKQLLLLPEHRKGASSEDDSDRHNIMHQWRPRIAATCKHFAAYSLETNRFNFSADIHDQRDWDDTYIPAFEACIHAGQFLQEHYAKTTNTNNSTAIGVGALGVMCSYNSINQVPACSNPAFLHDMLRQKWGFTGYVVSDCWAIANIQEHHHYSASYQEAVGMALSAGVDLDCGDTVQGYGMRALEEGSLDISVVDRALTNLFGVLMDLRYFEDDEQSTTKTEAKDGEEESKKQYRDELALDAGLQSIVLLKNGSPKPQSNPPLPLSCSAYSKVNLIGPLADDKDIMLGNYHGVPSHVITPRQGLEDMGMNVNYIHGCNVTGDLAENDIDLSGDNFCQQIMSANSDATILVVGLDQTIESEDLDRTSLLLPDVQRHTIEKVSHCAKEQNPNAPVILVVITGGPVDLSSYKANDSIDAILYTSYPGQAGGMALSHVLCGMFNPSARLVTTMYHNSYLDQVSLEDMRMRPEQSSNTLEQRVDGDLYPGRTYRFYNGLVVYPFGYGLSYTSWDYSIQLAQTNQEDGHLDFELVVDVSNIGSMDGSDTVLIFHKGPNAEREGNPIKSLVGFEKVFVEAGGTQLVKFNVEKWMTAQKGGKHVFMVGPTMDYILPATALDGGIPVS